MNIHDEISKIMRDGRERTVDDVFLPIERKFPKVERRAVQRSLKDMVKSGEVLFVKVGVTVLFRANLFDKIMGVMGDGRERTANDVAVKLKIRPEIVALEITRMASRGQLSKTEICNTVVYRLPERAEAGVTPPMGLEAV